MKLRGSAWVMGVLALALVACDESTPPPESKERQPVEPIKLGLLLPLSGSQASFGRDSIRGAELAVGALNEQGGVLNRPLEIQALDTGSSDDGLEKAVAALAEDPVLAIIGEVVSARSMLAAEAAQELEIPMISPASTQESLTATGPYIFRTCYADPFQAEAMAHFAGSIKARRVAMLIEKNNPYSEQLAASFRKTFVGAGGEISAEEKFLAGDAGFSEQIKSIKKSLPDLVYLPSYYPEAALIVREARQLGLEVPFLGGDGWDSPEFLSVGGDAVDDSYFTSHFSHEQPGAEEFVSNFENEFGEPPPPLAALTYDAVHFVAESIARAGVADQTAIRAALESAPGHEGITGTIVLGPNRTPRKPVIILRVEEGTFTYLETIHPDSSEPQEQTSPAPEQETEELEEPIEESVAPSPQGT